MTSERVSATMNARAADGKWNGGRIPYGYSYDKESATFSIREDEAAIVRKIYDIYTSTHSLVQTTTAVNDDGYRSRRGFKWTPSTIRIILSSPFYLGTMRYNYQDESAKTFSFKHQSEWILVENHHAPVRMIQTCLIHLQHLQGLIGQHIGYDAIALDLGKIPHPL